MFLKSINPREIIGAIKPEFAQFAKRVTYKPADITKAPSLPVGLDTVAKYELTEAYKAALNGSVDAQMLAVQGAIESYAKHKNVFVDMSRKLDIVNPRNPELSDRISISVYNPRTKSNINTSVGVLPENHTVNMVKKSKVMLHNPADGTDVIRPVQSEYEDTFVRYLYRTIENLVKRSNHK